MIATAAHGSELVPEVQNLRHIRERIYDTEAGWAMKGINSMYYSFSPDIADMQRSNPALNHLVRTAIQPALLSFALIPDDFEGWSLIQAVSIISASNILLYLGVPIFLGFKIYRIRHPTGHRPCPTTGDVNHVKIQPS